MMTNYSQGEKAVVATVIFKMKMQQTIQRIKEEHFQDTCGAKMIFEEDVYEEVEETQMEDLEQVTPKFKDTTSSTQPYGRSEPRHCRGAHDYLY